DFEALTGDAASVRETIETTLLDRAEELYSKKETELFGEEQMREIERIVLLQNVDKKWMDHLEAMDSLMETIGLQAYAQRNPISEYRLVGADMFDEMSEEIRNDTVRMLLSVMPKPQVELKRVEVAKPVSEGFAGGGDKTLPKKPVVNKTEKVGRNDPCPCGSGKKYKKCCGAGTGEADED
ncbi:MAG: SEC-C domain-containing protein, partial [Clostridia bacterium]|nr:SEC-C domain-containing protein [Clostridia bacterium]